MSGLQFRRYDDIKTFRSDVFPVLLADEIQNNLTISIISESKAYDISDWLMATVSDSSGIALTALLVKPFHLLLYETENKRCDDALLMLARELKLCGSAPPGVMAERYLSRRFAGIYSDCAAHSLYMTMTAMRLDEPAAFKRAPGDCRMLKERDMFFAPYWERAFSEECRATAFSIPENLKRLKTRLGKDTHYIWEDGIPVSQAVHGRDTPNGAVINGVYTPPHYRGRGYATSVVAELSNALLQREKSFCCLLAVADNLASCGLYRKLGYRDVCELEDIRFDFSRRLA